MHSAGHLCGGDDDVVGVAGVDHQQRRLAVGVGVADGEIAVAQVDHVGLRARLVEGKLLVGDERGAENLGVRRVGDIEDRQREVVATPVALGS